MKDYSGLSIVKRIMVKDLFGLYSYTLNSTDISDGTIIFYGDNGVGKSTILRMVFDLLSVSNSKGHRTALLMANFKILEVTLASNIKLTAEHLISETGRKFLKLAIIEAGKETAVWNYSGQNDPVRKMSIEDNFFDMSVLEHYELKFHSRKNRKGKEPEQPRIIGEDIYMDKLREVVPLTFILNADRRLDGDSISDGDDEVQYRNIMRYGEPKNIQDLVIRSREIALTQALSSASKWISRKAVIGTNQGSDNVHSTYIKILKHIVYPKNEILSEITSNEILALRDKIEELGEETSRLAKYELATALDMTEFSKVLKTQKKSNNSLSVDLLKPYIESLDVRLEAVRSIYIIIDKFITIINELLTDKKNGLSS